MERIIAFILIVLLVSCKQETSINHDADYKNISIDLSKAKKDIVQTAIDFDRLQWFYVDTVSLTILRNEYTEDLKELKKFDAPVLFKNLEEIQQDRIIYYLVIEKIIIENDSASVELAYPAQGARADLKFRKKSNVWRLDSYEVYEEEIKTTTGKLFTCYRSASYRISTGC